jgi:hypothetical protein
MDAQAQLPHLIATTDTTIDGGLSSTVDVTNTHEGICGTLMMGR